jgi:RNA polymerase sigma factor (sigma-70 family)
LDSRSNFSSYLPTVKSIARSVARRFPISSVVDIEDLIQVGCVGLCLALDNDDGRDGGFEQYAKQYIHGYILNEYKALDWCPVRMRVEIKKVAAEYARTGDTTVRCNNASVLDIHASKYILPLHKQNGDLLPIASKDESSLDAILRTEKSRNLLKSIPKLSAYSYSLISRYYFKKMTMREIAEHEEVTEPCIFIRLIKARKELKHILISIGPKEIWI